MISKRSLNKGGHDMSDYTSKVTQLTADVATIWKLQCKNLYNSKNLGALAVREALQNSIDALTSAVKAKKITSDEAYVKIDFTDKSELSIEDNGIGMDLQTIHDKFLSLGGTTKGQDDMTGGFGIAKAVILGCGDWFSIHTQDNYMDSSFLGKKPIEKVSWLQGTKLSMGNVACGENKVIGDRLEEFKKEILDYIATSEIPYTVYINGKEVRPRFQPSRKSVRSPKVFGITDSIIPDNTKLKINVYKNDRNGSKYMYIRLRGLTQYKMYLGWNSNCDITLDFQTKLDPRSTEYPFSTNREGLKTRYWAITDRIQDKVTKNPISISAGDAYRETLFHNRDKSAEFNRVVANLFSQVDTVALVDSIMKNSDGKSANGGIVNKVQEFQQDIKKKAEEAGVPVPVYVKQKSSDIENPLEYSWLIWEDMAWKGKKVNIKKAMDVIIIWDSILQEMIRNYKNSSISDRLFYPGIIVQDDTLGMCVEKTLPSGEQRQYVMINPFLVPTDLNAGELTMYIMNLASHELAHWVVGSLEAHGETWAYCREAIFNSALPNINNIKQMVNSGKFKQRLKAVGSRNTTPKKTIYNQPFPIDFNGKTIDEVNEIAEDYNINVPEFEFKYANEPIRKMRLIMAIKKAWYKEQEVD